MGRITFVATTHIPASAKAVFDWHEAPGAFERLTPSWERIRVLRHVGGIHDDASVSLLAGHAPLSLRWELEHQDYQHGRWFTDLQLSGPFRHWKQVRTMTPQAPDTCVLEDTIECGPPLGALGQLLGGPFVRWKLKQPFAYRHAVAHRAFEGTG